MKNTTTTAAALDRLTNTHTAWKTFAELVEASKGGYTPTIRQPSLATAVEAAGGKVWRG